MFWRSLAEREMMMTVRQEMERIRKLIRIIRITIIMRIIKIDRINSSIKNKKIMRT